MKKKTLAKLMKKLRANKKLKKELKLIHKLIKKLTKENLQLSEGYASLLSAGQAQQTILEENKAELLEIKQIALDGFGFNNCNNDNTITIYTDASYDQDAKAAGYGIVMVDDYGNTNEYSDKIKPSKMMKMFNNAGVVEAETYAILKALELAQDRGYQNVYLYTDSIFAKDWAEMGNQVNNSCAQNFYEKLGQLQQAMYISITWMRRCSCDYNTRADKLARQSMRKYRDAILQSTIAEYSKKQNSIVTLGELCDFSKLDLVG